MKSCTKEIGMSISERVLLLLREKPRTMKEVRQVIGGQAKGAIVWLKRRGKIHVCNYRLTKSGYVSVYAAGPGEDAPKPDFERGKPEKMDLYPIPKKHVAVMRALDEVTRKFVGRRA